MTMEVSSPVFSQRSPSAGGMIHFPPSKIDGADGQDTGQRMSVEPGNKVRIHGIASGELRPETAHWGTDGTTMDKVYASYIDSDINFSYEASTGVKKGMTPQETFHALEKSYMLPSDYELRLVDPGVKPGD